MFELGRFGKFTDFYWWLQHLQWNIQVLHFFRNYGKIYNIHNHFVSLHDREGYVNIMLIWCKVGLLNCEKYRMVYRQYSSLKLDYDLTE